MRLLQKYQEIMHSNVDQYKTDHTHFEERANTIAHGCSYLGKSNDLRIRKAHDQEATYS